MSTMILINSSRMVLVLFSVAAVTAAMKIEEQEEVDEEETQTVKTFATRSDYGQRAQVVTGTFR